MIVVRVDLEIVFTQMSLKLKREVIIGKAFQNLKKMFFLFHFSYFILSKDKSHSVSQC